MIFLRFSNNEYLTRLQNEGHHYLNSIQTFAEYIDTVGRGDVYENIFEQDYSENGIIQIKFVDTPNAELKDFSYDNQSIKKMATEYFVNIFCLYSIDRANYKLGELIVIPDEMKDMGTHCLIIFKGAEFIRRLEQALKRKNFVYKLSLVKYVDYSKYTGKKTVFEKPIEYEYQKEYRIAIHNTSAKAIELFIGNIEDISYKCPVTELKNLSFNYK
ncbi:hypothetical protein [Mucilaginibacter sp. OK098]|uniref:hypothetical protein n=1 Tax=Mucilaginibacter sp. OK098 TaxID=1855297 RepID=UPI00091EBFF7|nr:hypothetical protein [Mucilaginibacter sp. OK098]SHN13605.1 hypothetical protein SAMN05216524_105529 [Mucilaginibacter sp. OK098]